MSSSKKRKIVLDLAMLDKREAKELRRLDALQRQIGNTRNLKAMLVAAMTKEVAAPAPVIPASVAEVK